MNAGMRADGKAGRIAIVGMSCIFPGAPNLASFWSNIISGVDAIRDVSDDEWDAGKYYDPNAQGFGKTYCKRGGFITEYAEFDPLKFGVMPFAVNGTDPDQLLALKLAHDALADAGYLDRSFNGERAEVILGRISAPGAGSMNLVNQGKTVTELEQILHEVLPEGNDQLIATVKSEIQKRLEPCTSDNIPGVMPNVLAGRIAAKLGFSGRNMLIDAACASSMVAIETAVADLQMGTCDFALAGGVYVNSSVTMYNLFAGLGALSKTETIRPFDANADGTLLGEGIGMLCLKRYEDALKDGDRIYATICAVASTSDGFGGSVIAPSLEGEALALRHAYESAGVSPDTVELLEAHGTATPAGDIVELQAIAKVFGAANSSNAQWCALGSVKSMIGHCQSASAVAGVIKAALSLYHKVLPPTLNVESPNPKVDWEKHPCYINTETRPWIKNSKGAHPRRAAVSAFGFGGINSHTILEEHDNGGGTLQHNWDCEVLTFAAQSSPKLREAIGATLDHLRTHPTAALKDLAYSLNCAARTGEHRAAIIVSSNEDAVNKLEQAQQNLCTDTDKGILFSDPQSAMGGKLAFLYPGLGSAYNNMLADLCIHFPEVRQVFEIVDDVASRAGAKVRPSDLIFPAKQKIDTAKSVSLAEADCAVVAVLLAEYALYELLKQFDISPDALMGCSTGEFAAITTGGAVDVLSAAESFYRMSTDVGRRIPAESSAGLVSIRVLASVDQVTPLIGDRQVYVAADLGDAHIILTGTQDDVATLSADLRESKFAFHALPSPIVYHTPFLRTMVDANDEAVRSVHVEQLQIPTWSCSRAALFSNDVEDVRSSFTKLFAKPIALRETIRTMYADGVRKFVEVGPNGVLTALVKDILGKKEYLAIASNLASRSGLAQLQHLLAALFVHGVAVKFDHLYSRRQPKKVTIGSAPKTPSKTSRRISLMHTPLSVRREDLPALQGNIVSDDDSSSGEDTVMQGFLSANSEFFKRMTELQEQVMTTYLQNAGCEVEGRVEASPLQDGEARFEASAVQTDLPFLGRATVARNGESTTVEVVIDLSTDLYLLDHAIGGHTTADKSLRVYLMPLMVAIEIMAEAAFAHTSHGVPVRLEQVKAFRRIVVDKESLTLRLVATGESDKVRVQLHQDGDVGQPSMVADVIFADSYPSASPGHINVDGTRPTNLTSHELLYHKDAMFHGPRMQSVISLDKIGNRVVAGKMQARQASDWFANIENPSFLLDPLVLDNASQFVLFYLYEKNLPAKALLPFFIESIDVFGDRSSLPSTIIAAAKLATVSERATEADVEIGDGNQVWCRINNINSRRVILSDDWHNLVSDPRTAYLSQCDGNVTFAKGSLLSSDNAINEWCADYILTRRERDAWRNAATNEKRKNEWLLGRIAAKDAVRQLIKERFGKQLGMHDVEVLADTSQAPYVVLFEQAGIPGISVSISHTDGLAGAIAIPSSEGRAGIDIEEIRPRDPGFEELFLTSSELDYVRSFAHGKQAAEITRLWAAKEALFKALHGKAELTSMHSVEILPDADTVVLEVNGERFIVTSRLSENHAVACALISQPTFSLSAGGF